MKRLFLALTLSFVAGSASGADLLAVYQRALQNDPQLREAEATRLAALEAKPQAVSALLPQPSGNGVATREKDTGSTNTVQPVTINNGNGPVTVLESYPFDGRADTTSHRYGIDLKQNIFRWENWVAL